MTSSVKATKIHAPDHHGTLFSQDFLMKTANCIFFAYFSICAALQVNDPDPYLWIPLYIVAAWLSLLAIRRKYFPLLFTLFSAGCLIYAAVIFFSSNGVLEWWTVHNAESLVQEMQATKPWIESAREFFGLLIICCVHVCNLAWLRRKHSRPASVIVPLVR